jgi:hypothetical protein
MWSRWFDGRARVGISLALLVIASEMSTFSTLTSQGELFDAAVASVYVTLCSSVGTSLLLCIRAPADNIKSLVHRRPTPLPRDVVTIADVRIESDGPAGRVAIYSHRDRENTALATG